MFKISNGQKNFVYAILFIIILFSAFSTYNKKPYTEGIFWQVSKDGEVLGHIYGTHIMVLKI